MKKIVLTLMATVMALAVIEIVLRLCCPLWLTGSIHTYRYDSELGITLKSNLHDLTTTDYQQETITNALGSSNFQSSFKAYRKLVFAVGDSYTEGSGLPADAGYPFQLNLMLNLNDGRYRSDYGLVNLGVASYGGQQSLLRLKRFINTVGRPDYILYLASSNDAMDDQLFDSGYRQRHLVDGNPNWGIWLRPLQWLGQESEIGKRGRLAWAMFKRRDQTRYATHAGRPQISVAEREQSVFRQLKQIAADNHAHLIIGWSGVPMHDDGSYAWMKQWAAANGAGFIDWHPAEQSVVAAIPSLTPGNPHSGGHYRSWVQQLIARSCAKLIREAEAR